MKTYIIEANGAVHTVQAECKPTKKMLREILNRAEQMDNAARGRTYEQGRHVNNQFHQTSRGYGDYIYHQDLYMFEMYYAAWLQAGAPQEWMG